jgi:hypothetical protein
MMLSPRHPLDIELSSTGTFADASIRRRKTAHRADDASAMEFASGGGSDRLFDSWRMPCTT